MIAYIEGKIVDVAEDNLILEANHIGYNIRISTETAGRLPAAGEEVRIYTYTYVREELFEQVNLLEQKTKMFRLKKG